MVRACLGGWCGRRDDCPNFYAPTTRDAPSERLCDAGSDGRIRGRPITLHRPAGAWERHAPGVAARPFDGIAA
jgi:hypothetical protein